MGSEMCIRDRSYMARRMRQGATEQEAGDGWLTIPRPAHTRRVLTDQPPEWTEVLTDLRAGATPHELADRIRAAAWEVQHRHTERIDRKRSRAPRRDGERKPHPAVSVLQGSG